MKPVTQSVVLLVFLNFVYCVKTYSLVRISQGILSGTIRKSLNGREYSAFRGIPFAKPPIGKLRFKNPEPADKWEGVRQAREFGNKCPQSNKNEIVGNENCLFLNVYSPRLEFASSLQESKLLPVMVWIHGGAFKTGSSNIYGAGFLLDKDVVLVTINYRLGIFGFFSTADSAAPGNFGLKDQVLALEWIQENIKAFGGDPNRVTLFGESAGGASVSLHALSDLSTGLFHQYIIQSGNALCPWAYQKRSNFIIFVREIAALVSCPFITSESLVECLRTKDVETLINTSSVFGTISRLAQLTWTPTDEPESESAFLTENPKNLIKNNKIKDLPFISGTVSEEGLLITNLLYSNDFLYHFVRLAVNPMISYLANYYLDLNNKVEFASAVDNFYFNDSLFSMEKTEFLDTLTKFFSDGFFLHPELTLLERVTPELTNHNYFYSFGYRGLHIMGREYHGVKHGEDVVYLFPITDGYYATKTLNWTNSDKSTRKLMVDLWTSFAINGTPTSEVLDRPDLWTPFKTNNQLQIGNIKNHIDPIVKLSNFSYTKRINFWRENVNS